MTRATGFVMRSGLMSEAAVRVCGTTCDLTVASVFVARLQKQRLLLPGQCEVEAAGAKDLVLRRDGHDLEHLPLPRECQAALDESSPDPLSLHLRGHAQAPQLRQLAGIDLQRREPHDAPAAHSHEPCAQEYAQ